MIVGFDGGLPDTGRLLYAALLGTVEFRRGAQLRERFEIFWYAGLDGALSLALGVEFSAQQDGDVGYPEPYEEDNYSRERSVRLVLL
jgi:hypothetical protein